MAFESVKHHITTWKIFNPQTVVVSFALFPENKPETGMFLALAVVNHPINATLTGQCLAVCMPLLTGTSFMCYQS